MNLSFQVNGNADIESLLSDLDCSSERMQAQEAPNDAALTSTSRPRSAACRERPLLALLADPDGPMAPVAGPALEWP